MPKQPDKKDLLKNRKARMLEAWNLDGQKNASPLHLYWKKWFGKTWEWALGDPPHHIFGRDDTGKWDAVEYLFTFNRLEHNMAEHGCKQLKANDKTLTGYEYMWLILWLLRATPQNRWDNARALLGKKISRNRMEEIMKLGETLI